MKAGPSTVLVSCCHARCFSFAAVSECCFISISFFLSSFYICTHNNSPSWKGVTHRSTTTDRISAKHEREVTGASLKSFTPLLVPVGGRPLLYPNASGPALALRRGKFLAASPSASSVWEPLAYTAAWVTSTRHFDGAFPPSVRHPILLPRGDAHDNRWNAWLSTSAVTSCCLASI